MTLPNIITLTRLSAVPLIILLIVGEAPLWAFGLFVAAGLSDAADGAIARGVPGQASDLGRLLDPLADKALLVTLFVTLTAMGQVPSWLAAVVVGRDLMIVGGVALSFLIGRVVTIAPLAVSKANTVAQIFYLALVLAPFGPGSGAASIADACAFLVLVLTLASAAAYLRYWLRQMTGEGGK